MQTVEIQIPDSCPSCGGYTFNVWGTKMAGKCSVEVRCMRCGYKSGKYEP